MALRTPRSLLARFYPLLPTKKPPGASGGSLKIILQYSKAPNALSVTFKALKF